MMNAQKTLDFKSNKFAISSWLWFLFGFFVWIFLFVCLFISHSWLLEFLHDFISSVFALMCYFLWFAAGGGSSCSPVLARKHKGDYFWKQIFNCITSWFFWGCFLVFFRFVFFLPPPHFIVLLNFGLHSQLPVLSAELNHFKQWKNSDAISDIAIKIF